MPALRINTIVSLLVTFCGVSFLFNVFMFINHHRRYDREDESTASFLWHSLDGYRLHDKDSNHQYDEDNSNNPPVNYTPSESVSLAACLLIKDDNEILNEWIAYHYFTMNMTHLIVAIDPSSETSPTQMLIPWRRYIHIEEWHDADFMPESFLKTGNHIDPNALDGDASTSKWHQGHETPEQVVADKLQILNHRFRQLTFLSQCLKHYKTIGRDWVMHLDTDEYMVVNPFLRQRAGSRAPKSPRQQASLIHFVASLNRTLLRSANYPCISMPRLLFGSKEENNNTSTSTSTATTQTTAAALLLSTSKQLETLRWKFHADYNDVERNAQPKVLIDVSRVPWKSEMFTNDPFSIHRPSKRLCRRIDQLRPREANRFPFMVNHYLGSRERYFARNDTRRTERFYEFKAHVDAGSDTWIMPWIDGFVEAMGVDTAMTLLGR